MRPIQLLTAALISLGTCWATAEITPEPGWPVQTGFSVSPSATAAQMDGDPELEVVIASQDNYLYVFNHDGTLLPGWPQYLGETLWPDQWVNSNSSPAVADLDDDGELEIIVGATSANVYVFRRDGTLYPNWPQATSFMVFSTPAVGDIDGDDELEIVVGDNHGYVYAFNTDGTDAAGFPYSTPYTIHASPALGDLDGDGLPEIVISSEAATPDFFAIDGDGTDLPGFPLDLCPNVGIISSPSLADLDLDGSLEIVVGLRNGEIAVLDSTGNFLPGWPIDAGYCCESSPTLVDLDDDPELEIVVGMNDSQVVAYNHDGTVLPGWPVSTSYTVKSSASVADIDADGRLEIVIGENTGKVYGFETDGTAAEGFPLLDATYTIYSSPLLADLDLDGHLELLIGCNDTWVYCWDLGPGTYDPELLFWPQWRLDERNTARVNRPAYVELTASPTSVPPGESIVLEATITSISADTQEFEFWHRYFGEPGEVTDWPPLTGGLSLPPGGQAVHSGPLAIPPSADPGVYRVQIHLGEQGVGAFDIDWVDIEVLNPCPEDLNGDRVIDLVDLAILLAHYGQSDVNPEDGDIDGDGDVDLSDLAQLLAVYGTSCD